jgi:hypothetical protein
MVVSKNAGFQSFPCQICEDTKLTIESNGMLSPNHTWTAQRMLSDNFSVPSYDQQNKSPWPATKTTQIETAMAKLKRIERKGDTKTKHAKKTTFRKRTCTSSTHDWFH